MSSIVGNFYFIYQQTIGITIAFQTCKSTQFYKWIIADICKL